MFDSQTACKYISWSIKAGAALQMFAPPKTFTFSSPHFSSPQRRSQLYIATYLIQSMDAAMLRVFDAHPINDPLAPSPQASQPPPPSIAMTKIRSSANLNPSSLPQPQPTFSPVQVASPADACVWPIASPQLAAVAMLEEVLRAFIHVLDSSGASTGVARHFGAHDWSLLATNIRTLIQRGKYYDLPQFKHKNVQSDSTTAAALQLLAACVRAQCNHTKIVEDSSFLEAIFGIMNNPGAMGPHAALAAVVELAKVPGAQRALSSTFGYMTGTKAAASWKNSAMSKMGREIKRLCAGGGDRPAAARSSFPNACAAQNDEDEDDDCLDEERVPSGQLLPPISPSKSSRIATASPLSRTATASNRKAPGAASPSARSPTPANSSPAARSSSSRTGGVGSPAAAVLPALR